MLGPNCFGALQTKWAREHAWTVPQRQRSPAGCLEGQFKKLNSVMITSTHPFVVSYNF